MKISPISTSDEKTLILAELVKHNKYDKILKSFRIVSF